MMKNRWMLFADRGMIRLNQPPTQPGGDLTPPVPSPPTHPPAQPPAEPKVFDQEKVSEIAAREHDRGSREAKRAADQAWLDRLGVTSVEEVDALRAAAQAQKEADEKNKSQAQKDLEAAQASRAEAERLLADAKADRHRAALTSALTTAGMPAATQAYITVPGVTADSSAEDISAAIEKMKTEQPTLFGTPAPTPPPGADPKPPAGGRAPRGDFGGDGAKRFEQQAKREAPQYPAVP